MMASSMFSVVIIIVLLSMFIPTATSVGFFTETHILTTSTTKTRTIHIITPSQTMTVTPSLTPTVTPMKTPTLTVSPTRTETFSDTFTITSFTRPLTLSYSIVLTETMTVSESESLSASHSQSASESSTFSDSQSESPSLGATPSRPKSPSGTESESLDWTTSALPPSTSIPETESPTIRTECPRCEHGLCNNLTLQCECFFDQRRGFWEQGNGYGTCGLCAAGYWGPTCRNTCPGGPCTPCLGHGNCDDNIDGTGACICFDTDTEGHWTGEACEMCSINHYGVNCTLSCLCNGHGSCNDGRFGTGSCTCETGWSGDDCSLCNSTVVDGCLMCPNSCSGNGKCIADSTAAPGRGKCVCDAFFAGIDCSVGCPLECSNAGNCSDGSTGTGLCTCNPGHKLPACDVCEDVYWGVDCDRPCECSGHGLCSREDGVCNCLEGYIGDKCDIMCPGATTGSVCSGHGRCFGTGQCACVANNEVGYWTGTSCDQCKTGFGGVLCNITCPSTANGVCDGSGTCLATTGKCQCPVNRCGDSCDGTLVGGKCSPCEQANLYGGQCQGVCQCSSHGVCNSGQFGDGSCQCSTGWYGITCSLPCPGGAATPCSNHGTCSPETGICTCAPGYATENCSVACSNCGTNGHCDEGRTGTGLCICDVGWEFPDTECNTRCDCSAHGRCNRQRVCVCATEWDGPTCNRCAPGYFGTNCSLTCKFGSTSSGTCVCDENVGGEECDVPCPKYLNDTCSNQGVCDDGQGRSGTCMCFPGYTGPACQCSIDECESSGIKLCQSDGSCQCRSNFAGAKCEDCSRIWWGSDCSVHCDCAGHGYCARDVGTCLCDANEATGFWTGERCNKCAEGYVGAECKYPAVTSMNQLPAQQSRYSVQENATATVYAVLLPKTLSVLAGGTMYHAIFNATKPTTTILHEFSSPEETLENFCFSRFFKLWATSDGRQYIFAARGICGDLYQVFVSGSDNSEHVSPIDYHPIITTKHAAISAAVLFDVPSQSDITRMLCYAPSAVIPVIVTCYFILPSSVPAKMVEIELLSFLSVTAMTFDRRAGVIVLAGTSTRGPCAMIRIAIEAVLLSLTPIQNPFEANTGGQCLTITSLSYVPHLDFLLVGTTKTAGNSILAFHGVTQHLTQLDFGYVSANSIDMTMVSGVDTGIAVFNKAEHTIVLKLRAEKDLSAANPNAIKLVAFGEEFMTSTQIVQLVADHGAKMVYGAATPTAGVVLHRWLLVDVIGLSPLFADRRGGTAVTVTGLGFYDSPDAYCKFGNQLSPALFVDQSTAICIAPPALIAGCGEQVVEITFNGWAFTRNGVSMSRVNPPQLVQLTPRLVYLDSGIIPTEILVSGRGFLKTGSPRCRYSDGVTTQYAAAKFLSGASMLCAVPDNFQPFYSNLTLDIALDGGQYTNAGLPMIVAGAPLQLTAQPKRVVNASAFQTEFVQPILVSLVDEKGNTVRQTRTALPTTTTVSFSVSGINRVLTFTLKDGESTIFIPYFLNPKVGVIEFVIGVLSMTTAVEVEIVQGALDRIEITEQPAAFMFSGEPLPNSTKVQLLDVSGNYYVPTDRTPIAMELLDAGGTVVQKFADVAASSVGDATFDRPQLDTRGGVVFRLKFSLPTYPGIKPVISTIIQVQCSSAQFRFSDPVSGALSCRDCSAGLFCDGSDVVRVAPGYWMGNITHPVVYKCPNEETCLGGTCAPGYQGPLCVNCLSGYGKDQNDNCRKCWPHWGAALFVAFTVLTTFAISVIITLFIIQYCERDNNALILVIIWINFGQIMAAFKQLNAGWPFALQTTYSWAAVLTDFQMHSVSSDCVLRAEDRTFLDQAQFYYSSILMFPIVYLIVHTVLKWFPAIGLFGLRKDSLLEGLRLGDFPEHHRHLAVLSSVAQTYLFLNFQATITHAFAIFECQKIIDGDKEIELLRKDFQVNCDLAENGSYRAAFGVAITILVLYGLIIPLCQMIYTAFIISKFRKMKREHHSRCYLSLLLLGLRPEVWYWHTVVLVRKFVLMAAIQLNSSPLNSFLALWVLNAYALILWYIRPYTLESHNLLELASAFVAVMTVNAGLLNMSSPWLALRVFAIVFVFLLLIGVTIFFVSGFFSKIQRLMKAYVMKGILKKQIKKQRAKGIMDDDEEIVGVARLMEKLNQEELDEQDEAFIDDYARRMQAGGASMLDENEEEVAAAAAGASTGVETNPLQIKAKSTATRSRSPDVL